MSSIQRKKIRKKRIKQREELEAICALAGIKVIYTNPFKVKLLWAEDDEVDSFTLKFYPPTFGSECALGKDALARLDEMLLEKRSQMTCPPDSRSRRRWRKV